MTIWTCKGPLAALGLFLLSGCGDGGFPSGATFDQATRADLAGGAIHLQAPSGYCIDRQALHRAPYGDFALLARCDTLGLRSFFPGRNLALITVTTAPQGANARPPSLADLERSASPARVIETGMSGDLPMLRLDPPGGLVGGIAPQHWRSAFALNGQLVALALYAPESDAGPAMDAPALLADLAGRIRRASARPDENSTAVATVAPRADAKPDTKRDAKERKSTGEFISPFKAIGRLFD
ncbi:MAG: hypothetical protein QNK42_06165 [Pseudodonghicola sp.]|nr:hypothetical protein [Pseudodonghicola sp.]